MPTLGAQGHLLKQARIDDNASETPERVPGCMNLIVNTYVYAMTR